MTQDTTENVEQQETTQTEQQTEIETTAESQPVEEIQPAADETLTTEAETVEEPVQPTEEVTVEAEEAQPEETNQEITDQPEEVQTQTEVEVENNEVIPEETQEQIPEQTQNESEPVEEIPNEQIQEAQIEEGNVVEETEIVQEEAQEILQEEAQEIVEQVEEPVPSLPEIPEGLTQEELVSLKEYLVTETIINATANNIESIPPNSEILSELKQIQLDQAAVRYPEVYSNEQLVEAQDFIIENIIINHQQNHRQLEQQTQSEEIEIITDPEVIEPVLDILNQDDYSQQQELTIDQIIENNDYVAPVETFEEVQQAPEITYENNNISTNQTAEASSLVSLFGIAIIAGALLTVYKYYKKKRDRPVNEEKDLGLVDDFDRCV